MSNAGFSLLTITSGRDEHLERTLHGVTAMDQLPAEIVVAYMNQPDHPSFDFPIAVRELDVSSTSGMPLAAARNAAARAAQSDSLVFLDVDCIPAQDFADVLLQDLEEFGGLVMGTPLYLPSNASDFTAVALHRQGEAHPTRSALQPGQQSDYNLFWSLCFAISKTAFDDIGGFDETLRGYGGEDTDFAWSARKSAIPFALSSARVFHQSHASYQPPLNHFVDIVGNARRFHQKWDEWPMPGWLSAFASLGLIDWQPDATAIALIREPTAEEVARALKG